MTQGRMETGTSGARADRSPVRTAATVVGAVFVLVGILGFIPGGHEPV